MHIPVCEYVHMSEGAYRRHWHQVCRELELQGTVSCCSLCVLGTELRSFAKAVYAPNFIPNG